MLGLKIHSGFWANLFWFVLNMFDSMKVQHQKDAWPLSNIIVNQGPDGEYKILAIFVTSKPNSGQ